MGSNKMRMAQMLHARSIQLVIVLSCLFYLPIAEAGEQRGTEWEVTSGDTLYQIGRTIYPGNASKQSRLRQDIIELNPHIFANGANNLAVGVILQLPDFAASKGAQPMLVESVMQPTPAVAKPEPTIKSEAPTRTHTTIKSESPDKPVMAAKEPIKIARMVNKSNDGVTVSVTLEEIASQCLKYTETGFNFYAETIEGAHFSGKASVATVKPDSSEPGSFLINLSSKLLGLVIFVDLHDVPEDVAVRLEVGSKYAITGIIANSKVVGSDCVVRAIYQ